MAEHMEGGASRFCQAQPEGPGAQGPELSGGEGELLSVGSEEEAFGGYPVRPNEDPTNILSPRVRCGFFLEKLVPQIMGVPPSLWIQDVHDSLILNGTFLASKENMEVSGLRVSPGWGRGHL